MTVPSKKGYFITVEGIEGVGKSTSIKYIQSYLEQAAIAAVITREPGGTPVAEAIRQILVTNHEEKILPETELLLLFAARAQHLAEVVNPALEQGQWVVCDRFTDASYAYQGSGRGIAKKHIESLEIWLQGGLRPDLTIVLDAPVRVALRRARNRATPDRFEAETLKFFERVRKSYLTRAANRPGRYRIINAAKAPRLVQAQLKQVLQQFLAKKGLKSR